MNIVKKIFYIIIVFLLIIGMENVFFVSVSEAKSLGDMMSDATGFVTTGKGEASDLSGSMTEVTAEFVPLGQLLTMIGAGVMIAVTTYMGIKYLTSGPETQAKLKQQLIGVIVSGVVIFGAYGIWSLTLDIVQKFE